MSRECFQEQVCISATMSQHLILSGFVLAPTHNVDGCVVLQLPAPSNTQPKRCCSDQVTKDAGVSDQVTKDAGVSPTTDVPYHSQSYQIPNLVFGDLALSIRGTNPLPHLSGP